MRRIAIVMLLLVPGVADAGSLGTSKSWISTATPPADLALNNDDYHGSFDGNQNAFRLNESVVVVQSIVSTERMIPTVNSGGITEYALTIGGKYNDEDARPGVNLDSLFQVQLGFGTGDDFVRASELTTDLRFDTPDDVSPIIEDFYASRGDIPILKLLEHLGDTLIFQGSSTSGYLSQYNFYNPDVFHLPLDIPDLPLSVRDLYTSKELEGMGATETAFTIRVGPASREGDFNANGVLDAGDIDDLTGQSAGGMNPPEYDLNNDALVNSVDIAFWVKELFGTWIGDANLNGEFSSGDFVDVFEVGEYEDGLPMNSVWSTGDWNGDGEFDSSDLVTAFRDGGYERGRLVNAVPEPSSVVLLLIGLLAVVRRRN